MFIENITFNSSSRINEIGKSIVITKSLMEHLNKVSDIKGIVDKVDGNTINIQTPYGSMTVQLNEKVVINQMISIGIFDIPDRSNMMKLVLTTNKVLNIESQNPKNHEFIILKNHLERAITDLEVRSDNSSYIMDKYYNLKLLSENTGEKNVMIKISDLEPNGSIRIINGELIILKNNSSFKVLNAPADLLELISNSPKSITIQDHIPQNNQNKVEELITKYNSLLNTNSFKQLLDVVPNYQLNNNQIAATDNLYKIAFLILKTLGYLKEDSKDEMLGLEEKKYNSWNSIFLPIFNGNQFTHIKFFIHSKSPEELTQQSSKRFILELTKDGHRNLIDCLFTNHNNDKKIDIIWRMEKQIGKVLQQGLENVFHKIICDLQIQGSITFVEQSNDDMEKIMHLV